MDSNNNGERGIRTLGTSIDVQRISNQPLSSTQPSLLKITLLFYHNLDKKSIDTGKNVEYNISILV
jgi:hypothetical protein